MISDESRHPSVNPDDLREVEALRGVDIEQVFGLLKTCPLLSLKQDEILISEGEPSTCVYMLLSGRLRVHVQTLHSTPLNILYPGQILGEVGVMDSLLRSSLVVADTASSVLIMSTQVFWSLIYASHAFAINLLTTQSQRLRDNTDAIREVTRLKEQYQRHAIIDGLTGLYNRRWLDEVLPRQMKRSLLDREPLAIVMIDIDYFKKFNDTHGHQAGDWVLYEIGRSLKELFRPGDSVARYGGEEFTVLLPGTSRDVAFRAADRVRKLIAAKIFSVCDTETDLSLTLSMGIAVLESSQTVQDFIGTADTALYRAKQSGRNCVVC